jgi:glycosyltransferase involved in cell wall biosynthesis
MLENNNPKVSIIVPVYNTAKYIKQCVNSITSQDYTNIEVILVNDGSTDKSPEICETLSRQDDRVKVFHKLNEGAAEARNFGLRNAGGSWIIFVDSDDFWNHKSGLANLIKFAGTIDYPFDFIIFNYTRYFQEDKKYIIRPDFSEELIKYQKKKDRIEKLLKNSFIPAPPWGKLIRSSFLKKHKIEFIRGINAEDIPWFIAILEKAENFALTNIRFHVYRKQVPGALTNLFNYSKYTNLLHIVKNESSRLKNDEEVNELNNTLLSFMSYQYIILLATSANFKGKEFSERQKELSELNWLLEYDLVGVVKRAKVLLRFLPGSLVSIILHYYAKLIVNRTKFESK